MYSKTTRNPSSTVKPAEIQLVAFPLRSDGENLLRIYIQDLCYRKVLIGENKMVFLNKRRKHRVSRLHLRIGPNFQKESHTDRAESFLLKPFSKKEEIRFYELRQHIVASLDKDLERFKSEYVYPDARDKGLIVFRFFRTSKGKRTYKPVKKEIDELVDNMDLYLTRHRKILVRKLEQLENHISLIPPDILGELADENFDVLDLSHLKFLAQSVTLSSGGAYLGGMGGGSFGGGGGFGGFGGGGFGGGGAGGSW